MKDITMISRKTPKTKRPVSKNEYTLSCAVRKTPFVLTKVKKFSIGRLKKNDISLPQKTTSDLHATIKWSKSSFRITDEKSTNGTYVNGKRIEETTALADGDKIKIGKFSIIYKIKKIREKVSPKPAAKKSVKKGAKPAAKPAAKSSTNASKETSKKTTKKASPKKSAKLSSDKTPKKTAKAGQKKTVTAGPKKTAKTSPKKAAKPSPKKSVKATSKTAVKQSTKSATKSSPKKTPKAGAKKTKKPLDNAAEKTILME